MKEFYIVIARKPELPIEGVFYCLSEARYFARSKEKSGIMRMVKKVKIPKGLRLTGGH